MSGIATAIIGSAVIGGGAAIIGGGQQTEASKYAGDLSYQAMMESNKLTREMWEQGRKDMAPYRWAGYGALSTLTDLMGIAMPGREPSENFGYLTDPYTGENLYDDPSYKFRMEQGVEALDKSASARGKLLSGEQDEDLITFGQEFASTEFERAYNRHRTEQQDTFSRLFGITEAGRGAAITGAQMGQQAAGTMSASTNLAASQMGQAEMNAANARAGMYTGVASSVNQGIGNLLYYQGQGAPQNTYGGYQPYGSVPPASTTPSSPYYRAPTPTLYT